MSTQCNRFVQNAWKKELCSNCFKPREEHTLPEETFKLNIGKALNYVKTDNVKIQVFYFLLSYLLTLEFQSFAFYWSRYRGIDSVKIVSSIVFVDE